MINSESVFTFSLKNSAFLNRHKLQLFFGFIVTFLIIKYSPYGIDEHSIKRIRVCGIQQIVYDFAPHTGPFTPYEISNLTDTDRANHKQQLSEMQLKYKYGEPETFKGFPPSIDNFQQVLCEEAFTFSDSLAFFGNLRKSIYEIIFAKFILSEWKGFKSFDIMFTSPFIKRPTFADKWRDDIHFSKQRLTGTNPVVIFQIKAFPSNFAIDRNRLSKFIGSGVDIDNELANGKFYLENYEQLVGVPQKNGRVFPTIALHYVRPDGILIPVAIQLDQDASISKLGVFYPDEGTAWLFAKTATQLATALHHQIVTHLLKTHLFVEVWSIATHRNLPEQHPMFILLQNHVEKTMAINNEARILLIPQIIDKIAGPGIDGVRTIIENSYKTYNFTNDYLKNELISRGVWDPTVSIKDQVLPNYYYRDYSLLLWDAIEVYVTGIVNTFYNNDESVINDEAIQLWAQDIIENGKMKTFPQPSSKKQLSEILTMIIHTSSVQHAAINFGQYEALGYTPNLPLSLTLENIPEKKEDFTEELLFKALPPFGKSLLQTASVWVLSTLPIFEHDYITHPVQWNHKVAQEISNRFVEKLYEISDFMAVINNAKAPYDKYTVLDPRQIPKTTAI